MKIVSAAEMREIDRVTSAEFGVPSLTLMENAGTAVADFAMRQWPAARVFLIVCGKGNNGGDGFVAARRLKEAGREVRVLLLAEPKELRGDAAAMFSRMPLAARTVARAEELQPALAELAEGADLLIDALLGTGVRLPVEGLYRAAIEQVNQFGLPVLSVDIPSGADADAYEANWREPMVRAHAVVTFTAPRPAHVFAQLTNGPIVCADIGSPAQAVRSQLGLEVTTARDLQVVLAPRAAEAHKGDFGHVLVVGGSVGKSGAAAMAGMAALRAGCGLCTVASPRSVQPLVAGFAPELMTEPLAETADGTVAEAALSAIQTIAGEDKVVALGPGLSRNSETVTTVRAFVRNSSNHLVLDADALNAFAGADADLDDLRRLARIFGEGEVQSRRELTVALGPMLVLTPHPGEMRRLTEDVGAEHSSRIRAAQRFAQTHSCTVVLKGHRTVIAHPFGTLVNATGNPGMATGGTGDVLTGMIAGLLAQLPEGFSYRLDRDNSPEASDVRAALQRGSADAAAQRDALTHRRLAQFRHLYVAAAVFLHGLAGDIAREEVGEHSLVATDLLRFLPAAFMRAQSAGRERFVRVNG